MKRLLVLVMVLLLSACNAKWVLPDGVTCPDNPPKDIYGKAISQPADANPKSDQYDPTAAYGYYTGLGCNVSGLSLPAFGE